MGGVKSILGGGKSFPGGVKENFGALRAPVLFYPPLRFSFLRPCPVHESRNIYLLDLRHILRITELNNQERKRQINGKGEMREKLAALCCCSRNIYKGWGFG